MKQITLLSLLISTLSATTIHVPADYSTIQAGINASNDGDTVLVAEGTYAENLILEKEIVLASHAIYDDLDSDWLDNTTVQGTVISGSSNGSCLLVRYGNIQPSIIGFTFQDGTGTDMNISNSCSNKTERSGGAIVIYKAYPNVNYNRFKNNGLTGYTGDQNTTNGGAMSHFADDDVEFDEDRDNANQNSNTSRDIPNEMNIQNNYFENNGGGDGKNFYSFGYDGSINMSGSVFEDIDCESGTANDFVLRSLENEANFIQNNISGNCIEENIYYVSSTDGDDTNAGTEAAPLQSIRHALSMVKPASDVVITIQVGPGVYSEYTSGDIFPIVLPDKVHLIGSDPETTILDADASSSNEAAVLIIKEVEDVYVANVTLTGGYSESHGCTGGGGLLITANDMYNLFEGDGGTGVDAYTTPHIENVIIEDNHSHNGGGVSFFRTHGPVLEDVIIRDNQATAFGGGLFCYGGGITMTGCTVDGNQNLGEGQGGGMMLAGTEGTFDNMTIINNTANEAHGGGLWTNSSGDDEPGWVMTNSTISGNHSDWFGGGMMLAWSRPTIINCTISENVAYWGGGGIMALSGSFVLQESLVTENGSGGGGGGLFAWGPLDDNINEPPVIEDCIISSNGTNSSGGGIYVEDYEEAPVITRTFVVNNGAAENHGGILVDATDATVTNVTVSENTSGSGGGIGLTEGGHIDLTNSIVWNNEGDEVWDNGGTANVNYSNIQGGFDGEGNIDDDPLFTDVENGDFTLLTDSPCIDAGTADLDGDGTDDIFDYFGLAPDMGADEYVMGVTGLEFWVLTSSVILAWDAIAGTQYYAVERSTDPEFEDDVVSSYVEYTSYTDDELEYNVTYYYRVAAFLGFWSDYSEVISVTIESVGLADDTQIPGTYNLHQNHPNPFNPTTKLRYDLPDDGMVNITIYDMMGRVVRNLVNDHQSAGYKTIQWNGTNGFGEPVAAGVYLYQIHAGNFQKTKKMILLK